MLRDRAMSVKEIAKLVGQKETTTVDDLEHLLKSLRHQQNRAVIQPSVCKKCGFEFSTDKLSKPSRCPKCKGTWLSEPRIQILD